MFPIYNYKDSNYIAKIRDKVLDIYKYMWHGTDNDENNPYTYNDYDYYMGELDNIIAENILPEYDVDYIISEIEIDDSADFVDELDDLDIQNKVYPLLIDDVKSFFEFDNDVMDFLENTDLEVWHDFGYCADDVREEWHNRYSNDDDE